MAALPEDFRHWRRRVQVAYLALRAVERFFDVAWSAALVVVLVWLTVPLVAWVLAGQLGSYPADTPALLLRAGGVGAVALLLASSASVLRERMEERAHG